MKRVGKEPRLLPKVMEAIASLKERQGSTQKQIIEHVAHILRKSKDSPRNVTMQIRRALEHGLHSGLIKHRSGKYTLGLDKRDYAIFRRFRQIDGPLEDCTSCRRGRRRGRRGRRGRRRRSRRRRRHGRRRPVSGDEASERSDSERSMTGGTPEPMDRRSRRRRRRGRRGRRRGRRGRRRAAQNVEHSDSSEAHQKDSNTAVPAEKRRSEQEKIDYNQSKTASNHSHHQDRNHQDRNHQERNQDPEEDDIECGNPECLCNIKQEDDSPRCMSSDNYYNDSYLN